MTDLLFDAPWWLPAAVAVLGIIIFVAANRRAEVRLRWVGIGVVALALLIVVVSYIVDTPVEKAVKGSRAIVAAFVARDWQRFQSLLAGAATVSVLEGEMVYDGRPQILAGAQAAREQYGIERAVVTGTTAQRQGPIVTSEMSVLSEQTVLPYPLTTVWQLEWRADPAAPGGWSIDRVTCIRIGNATGAEAARQFPAR